jgi:hypothetical protein
VDRNKYKWLFHFRRIYGKGTIMSVFLFLTLLESLGQYVTLSFVDIEYKLSILNNTLNAKCKYML